MRLPNCNFVLGEFMPFILVGVLDKTKNKHTKFQAVIFKNKNDRTVQNTENCRKLKVEKITFQISEHTKSMVWTGSTTSILGCLQER